jgi:putative endonuclease
MSACFYILHCADRRHYFGITSDLMQRLRRHPAGRVPSTRARRPVELIYYEEHETLHHAGQRERYFKNHKALALGAKLSTMPLPLKSPFTRLNDRMVGELRLNSDKDKRILCLRTNTAS